MKQLNKYVCLVDNYRRPSRQRNTKGRYLVCAKTEREAKEILQNKIGFGSVQHPKERKLLGLFAINCKLDITRVLTRVTFKFTTK